MKNPARTDGSYNRGRHGLVSAAAAFLVVVMFVSVTVLDPVVSEQASAEDDEDAVIEYYEGAVPDDVLSQLITEELERVDQLDEAELQEQYGISKQDYTESIEAMRGQALVLVGDEDGTIHVETYDPIEKGRSGAWYEGNNLYFGIDSVAWGAIKWWFSDECIDGILDQICHNEKDEADSAQEAYDSAVSSISEFESDIFEIDRDVDEITGENTELEKSAEEAENESVAALGRASDAAQAAYEAYVKVLAMETVYVNMCEDAISFVGSATVDEVRNALEGSIPETLMFLYAAKTTDIAAVNALGTVYEQCVWGKFFTCLMAGDYAGAQKEGTTLVADYGSSMAYNYLKGDLEAAKEYLRGALEDHNAKKAAAKADADSAEAKFKEAKKTYEDSKARKENAVEDWKKLNEDVETVQEKYTKSLEKLETQTSKFDEIEQKYRSAEQKFNAKEISEEEFNTIKGDYETQRLMKEAAVADEKEAKAAVDVAKMKANDAKIAVKNATKTVKEEGLNTVKAELKSLEKNVVDKSQNLRLAKIANKTIAKATAKTSARAAICCTGIGLVISIILDIVIAALIKLIEMNLDTSNVDTDEEYGIKVSVKVFEQHTIDFTFRFLWKTYHVRQTVTLPCLPVFLGVSAQ